MTTWILITVACCLTAFAWLMGLLAPRWCSARAWLALYAGHGLMFVLLVFAAARAELRQADVRRPEPIRPEISIAGLKPADMSSTELAGAEFTGDRARFNGVECPVYVRTNGTYFAVAGEERIDVERVSGYVRRNGNAVRPYYRAVADASGNNNLSADLHRGVE